MTQEIKDYSFLHFIVLIWGFTAIIGVLISLPTVEMVFYRVLISSIGLVLVIASAKKSFKLLRKKDYLITLGAGGLIAAHWILFFLSARVANVSVCLAGMATTSLWTSLIEPLAYKSRIKGFEVVLSIIAIVGIVIIFNVEFDYFLGLVLAIGSAILSAIFTVINGKQSKRADHFVITLYEMIGATICTALFFPIYLQLDGIDGLQLSPTLTDWFYLAVLGLVCTVFAYSYSVQLMKRLSAFSVNLSLNLEPVYGILMALIFFPEREKMTTGFYLGTALILVSVLIYPIINRRLKKRALDTDLLR